MARTAAGTTTATVTWLGHATVLLELGGVRLLTDPVLRSRVAHLRRHAPAPATPRDVDAVLLSHAHHDHLDLASLRRLGPVRSVMVPRGTARALRRVRARGVTELVPGDERAVGEVSVRAVRADHDGRRARRGPDVQALGYVVEHAGMRIYFAGDTDRFAGMGGGAALDLALLPVWGWGPSLGSGHMGPRDAARA